MSLIIMKYVLKSFVFIFLSIFLFIILGKVYEAEDVTSVAKTFPVTMSIKQDKSDLENLIILIENIGEEPVYIVRDVAEKIKFSVTFTKNGKDIHTGYQFGYISHLSVPEYKINEQIGIEPHQKYSFSIPVQQVLTPIKELKGMKNVKVTFQIQAYISDFFGSNENGILQLKEDFITSNFLEVKKILDGY